MADKPSRWELTGVSGHIGDGGGGGSNRKERIAAEIDDLNRETGRLALDIQNLESEIGSLSSRIDDLYAMREAYRGRSDMSAAWQAVTNEINGLKSERREKAQAKSDLERDLRRAQAKINRLEGQLY